MAEMSKGGKLGRNASEQVIVEEHQFTKAGEIRNGGWKQAYKLSAIQSELYYTVVLFAACHTREVANINSLVPVSKGGVRIECYGLFECQQSSLIGNQRVVPGL